MKFIVASDHVALTLKSAVVEHLKSQGHTVLDAGPDDPAVSVDYPDFAQRVTAAVAGGEFEQGVLICGTGLGMSIAANKVPGIRAALCHDSYTAHQARAHNDANILCMGAWIVSPQRMPGILDEWLKTPFEHGRHVVRLAKVEGGATTGAPGRLRVAATSLTLSIRPTLFAPVLFAGNLLEGMAQARAAGFTAVEIGVRAPEDYDVAEIKRSLKQHGLSLSSLATGQSWIQDGLSLTAADPAVRTGALARLRGHMRLASETGAALIIGGIRGMLSGSPEEQTAQRAAAAEAVRTLAREAAGQEVTLLLEPINRYETNFLQTVAEALAFLDQVGEPGVKVLADTFHMNIEETDVPGAVRQAGPRLGYVHFADNNRHAPGQGHFDFAGLLAALDSINYHGPVGAEILPRPDAPTACSRAGAYFQSVFDPQPA